VEPLQFLVLEFKLYLVDTQFMDESLYFIRGKLFKVFFQVFSEYLFCLLAEIVRLSFSFSDIMMD